MALPIWSKDRIANFMARSGSRWNDVKGQSVTVTYSFPTSNPGYGTERYGYSTFNEAQRTAARTALNAWAEVSGLTFQEVTTNNGLDGQIRLANTTSGPSVAWAYYPGGGSGGDVWINYSHYSNKSSYLVDGEYGLMTMVHELGHSLGLSHPGYYNGTADPSKRLYRQDSWQYTVMSYFGHANDPYAYSSGPLLHDIYAIQKLYGVNWGTRNTDTTYSWGNNAYFIQSIWDGGGVDVIDASNQTNKVYIDLRAGRFSSIGTKHYYSSLAVQNLSIAYGAVIENAKGGFGDDSLVGNSWNNVLTGNDGNDLMNGLGGNDTLVGGAGNDTYRFTGSWGVDVIDDASGVNTVDLRTARVYSERVGDDLVITKTGYADTVVISDYYLNTDAFVFKKNTVAWTPGTGETQDDVGNILGMAVEHTLGGSSSGTIDYAKDRDWYRVTLTGNQEYQFDLKGRSSGEGTMSNPYLYLFDSTGTRLAANDNGGQGYDAKLSFFAATSGTYYLLAKHANSTLRGSYILSSQTLGGITTLGVGATANADIAASDERDWYKIDLAAGATYQFDLKGRSTDSGTLSNPHLALYDSDGNLLTHADNSGVGYDARVVYHAATSGSYYLRAKHSNTGTGTYTLSAQELVEDVSINAGSTVSGTISKANEYDWFKISLTAGTYYQVDLKGKSSDNGTLGNPLLHVFRGNGELIGGDDNGGTGYDARYSFIATYTGDYYIRARHGGTATGSYTLSSQALSTSSNLAVGGEVNASIASQGELDWYKISLEAGATYQFDMRGKWLGYGTLGNPKLNLFGPDGSHVNGDDNGGYRYDSRLVVTAKESGDYYLRAMHYNPIGTGTYNLEATLLEASPMASDDHGDTAGASTLIAVGDQVAASIDDVGDVDLFKVHLESGVSYRFDAQSDTGVILDQKALADPFLSLINTDGTSVLAADDNSGSDKDSQILFTAAATGDYYLKMESKIAGYGHYRLLAAQVG